MDLRRLGKAFRSARRLPELTKCIRDSPDWPWLIPSFLGFSRANLPRVVRMRDGIRLPLSHVKDVVTAWGIFFGPEYRVPRSTRVVIDAGANIGAFSLYVAGHATSARVIALEPFPSTFDILSDNIALNNLQERVLVRPWALGGHDEIRQMEGENWPSHVRRLTHSSSDGGGVSVETVSLATLVEREALLRVDLLKIDIEGAEFEALLGQPRELFEKIGAIALEYHPIRPGCRDELFRALSSYGYRLLEDRPCGCDAGVAHFSRST